MTSSNSINGRLPRGTRRDEKKHSPLLGLLMGRTSFSRRLAKHRGSASMCSRASDRRRIVYDTRSLTFFNVVRNVEDCTSRCFEAQSPRYQIVPDGRIFGSASQGEVTSWPVYTCAHMIGPRVSVWLDDQRDGQNKRRGR